jgi:hypothetical protein
MRLLVPVGFMPMAGHDGLGIVLCPAQTGLPSAHAGHALQHAGHNGGEHAPADEHHAPCLFAASAAPPVPATALLAAAAPASAVVAQLPAQTRATALPVILRAQSARAPPAVVTA